MEILQIYQTSIMEVSSGYGIGFVIMPSRSLRDGESKQLRERAAALAEGLKLHIESFFPPSAIPQLLEEMIRAENKASFLEASPADVSAFAQHVAFSRLVPFEESPLGGESLATIASNATKAGTVGIGTAVGFVSGGFTPLLLITVPAGIILCGAAVSFAKWIEENRAEVWAKCLRFTNPEALHTRESVVLRSGNEDLGTKKITRPKKTPRSNC